MIFYGLADAHGIESFKPAQYGGELDGFVIPPRELTILSIRAQANRHRHAVVYKVDLEPEDAKEIQDLLADEQFTDALIHLKVNATEISLVRSLGAEKSWRMIPNPDLDPYH